MKATSKLTERRGVLLCVGLLLLIAAAAIVLNAIDHARYTSPEYYAAYVAENEAELIALAEEALLHKDAAKTPPEIIASPLIEKSKFIHVQAEDDYVVFIIDFDYAPVGGRIGLIYRPDGEYEPTVPNPEDWRPVETGDENILRWEGGMADKGWIDVTRLSDCFFLEKAFIPT